MSEYYNESPLQILVTKTRDLAQETPNSSRALGKALLTMMETFLDHAGWDHIDDAAARANGNFIAEYITGVETPGIAGTSRELENILLKNFRVEFIMFNGQKPRTKYYTK